MRFEERLLNDVARIGLGFEPAADLHADQQREVAGIRLQQLPERGPTAAAASRSNSSESTAGGLGFTGVVGLLVTRYGSRSNHTILKDPLILCRGIADPDRRGTATVHEDLRFLTSACSRDAWIARFASSLSDLPRARDARRALRR